MYIKDHNNRNKYLRTPSGYWIRNFRSSAPAIDINNLIPSNEMKLLIDNEIVNKYMIGQQLGSEHFPKWPNCVIVSDGFDFDKKKHLLDEMPSNVCIIGTSRALAKWNAVEGKIKRRMDFYVVNNPFSQCLSYLPKHGYYPKCVASVRTNPEFLKKYKGNIYSYFPAYSTGFGQHNSKPSVLDDYRNPICAAVHLASKFDVRKLLLFCCDSVFVNEQPGAEKLPNGLWMYPQHKISHELIEGNLYWFKNRDDDVDVEVATHTLGLSFTMAKSLDESEILQFFSST